MNGDNTSVSGVCEGMELLLIASAGLQHICFYIKSDRQAHALTVKHRLWQTHNRGTTRLSGSFTLLADKQCVDCSYLEQLGSGSSPEAQAVT